jgi:hypothetical protein
MLLTTLLLQYAWQTAQVKDLSINIITCGGTRTVQSVQQLAMSYTAEGLKLESRYGKNSSPLHVVQTGSGAHPASYPKGTGGPFSGDKASRV